MSNIWKGRKYLKLERCRSPWYTTNYGKDICLKHYFTLWGWCLALRIIKTGYADGTVLKAKLSFGYISEALSKKHDESNVLSNKHKPNAPYKKLYCYNKKGDLLGSLDDLSWIITNNLIADDSLKGVVYNPKEDSYIGFSHRARQSFKIGDKLFDPEYKPKQEHFEPWEWAGFLSQQFKSQLHNNMLGWKETIPLIDVIPFIKRGSVVIETHQQARQAAYNFAKDVS